MNINRKYSKIIFENEWKGRAGVMIQVEHISKDFKKMIKAPGFMGSLKSLIRQKSEIVHAVDDISFHVEEGEVLGFIGPNGAGKSTMIKMLTGILCPTSGFCRINGKIPQKNRKEYVKEIGVVFGQRTQLWWDLPLTETYTVLKEIYGVDDASFRKRMSFFNDVLGLNEFIKSPVRTLSLGQRMRADIAASLLHSPKVLFLDEPTIGLDVVVKENIRNAINVISQQEKTTVILTTHDLSDIEYLCRHIVMIDKGRLIYDGSLQNLKSTYGQVREFSFIPEQNFDLNLLDYRQHFHVLDDDVQALQSDAGINVKFNTEKIPAGSLVEYTLSKVRVKDMAVKDADAEEIIRRIYKKEVSLDA